MHNLDIEWLDCTVYTVLEILVHSAIFNETYAQLSALNHFWGFVGISLIIPQGHVQKLMNAINRRDFLVYN